MYMVNTFFTINRAIMPIFRGETCDMFTFKRANHEASIIKEKDEHLKRLLDVMTNVFVDTNQIVSSNKEASAQLELYADDQAEAMEDLISFIKDFTKGTEQITLSVSELSNIIVSAVKTGKQLTGQTEQMDTVFEEGRQSIQLINDSVASVIQSFSALSTVMEEVNKSTSEIQK